MTSFGRALQEMTVRSVSPDRRVRASVRGRGPVRVSFVAPDCIDEYNSADELGVQVGHAIQDVVEARDQARTQLVDENPRLQTKEGPHWDAVRRRFHEECEDIAACGLSPNDVADVSSLALRSWQVTVDVAAFQEVTASESCSEVNAAIRDAHRDHAAQMAELKRKHFPVTAPHTTKDSTARR